MRTNTTKAKLAEGKVVFGAIISRYAPDLVELFGAIGYDFVMIDCEHGPMDLDEVEHMVRAAEVFGITPITRIPNHEDSTILRFLDRGVQGIIVPHINTREAATTVAKAARYYPDGHRGVGGGRAHDYGIGVSREESTRWVNSQLLVIPMVEETAAVDNLDAILTVPGVDVLHVASGDLGQSMGNPGAAAVRQLMRQVIPREYCLSNHIECENRGHVRIDPETGKQGHGEVHHLFRLGDNDRASLEAPEPMALLTMIALNAIGLGFAHDEFLGRQH